MEIRWLGEVSVGIALWLAEKIGESLHVPPDVSYLEAPAPFSCAGRFRKKTGGPMQHRLLKSTIRSRRIKGYSRLGRKLSTGATEVLTVASYRHKSAFQAAGEG
jgi:hypothetical protein